MQRLPPTTQVEAAHLALDSSGIGFATGLHARFGRDLRQQASQPSFAPLRGEGPLARAVCGAAPAPRV